MRANWSIALALPRSAALLMYLRASCWFLATDSPFMSISEAS